MERNTRLIDCTWGDIEDGIKELLRTHIPDNHEYVYSLKDLAKALQCSEQTIQRRKRAGEFDNYIQQSGRKVIIDITAIKANCTKRKIRSDKLNIAEMRNW